MSRFRLQPTPDQEAGLLLHCSHARFVWNLAVEQHAHWQTGRPPAPCYVVQARQLTEARAECEWLRSGSVTVQQQALRDFAEAMASYFRKHNRRPTWRKAGRNDGFRQVAVRPGHVERLNRRFGRVWVPKVGWVRFRWSRAVSPEARSYRVTRNHAGQWHVAFAVPPKPIPAPDNGKTVGIDRGVVVSAALSNGDMLQCPGLTSRERSRLVRLQRRLARAERHSSRRRRVRTAIARLQGRETRRRNDWLEKVSTDIARRFDLIRVEDLDIRAMTRTARGTADRPGHQVRQKAGLNRSILAQGWGQLVTRLEQKAPGRVEKVRAAFTSQQCSTCGNVSPESRESQAVYRCVACGFTCHADVNAAMNIAAGQAVTAREGGALALPVNREPQLATFAG
ncbi:RNA-guided endonuclease InsQ/TnpB family protein [Amycolatopsis sp. cg5]|uniref:RNA-guided endonuclease InsQ/TnpB family protein n=1 Tax=Amycolatopsis sp. cg5 TaxID=3238802 RepID=UPI0035241B73